MVKKGRVVMVKPVALANAVAAVGGVLYVACAAASAVAPNLVIALGQSWAHTMNLEAIKATTPLTVGGVLLGFVTFVVATWVVAYASAVLYNIGAKTAAEEPQTQKPLPTVQALR